MALETIDPAGTAAWQQLKLHFNGMQHASMKQMFAEDAGRTEKFHIEWENFIVDYSKNIINDTTIKLLINLAEEMRLREAIDAYFSGDAINRTEGRAVLHTALRAPKDAAVYIDGKNIIPEIYKVRNKMKVFCHNIITGERKGYTCKPFTDVVNIGIGGSDLGPDMVTEALKYYKNHLNIHFISNIDGDHVTESLTGLDPETTLFVIVSKTFTTQETLSNAETAKSWFLQKAGHSDVAKHFVAVSVNTYKVTAFGIDAGNIFPMWDWTGGRFSLWSAVGLSISLGIGFDNFEKLLHGAHKMDTHFKNTAFDKNIPVILALLSIWYNNFFNAETEAIIPYTQYLKKLAPYLQQGIMESNGKSTGRDGKPVTCQTGTIIWGEPGSNAQHAFFQLLHQGTKLIPADFIGFTKPLHGNKEHHDKLMSNFFAQTEALLNGKAQDEVKAECIANNLTNDETEFLLPFKIFSGNKPTNTLLIKKLTPENLGSLIALYEHKIFVQGILWNIFSYDQWGVELGKQLATCILSEITSRQVKKHDGSTSFLIEKYLGI